MRSAAMCCAPQALAHPDYAGCREQLERVFREYGLPGAILSDNGTPFASLGAGGLSRLGVWWVKLGITPLRIEPGKPEQNGRHERRHRTLKAETASPPAANLAEQQVRCDRFRYEFKHERPHEALGPDRAGAALHLRAAPLSRAPRGSQLPAGLSAASGAQQRRDQMGG